MHKQIPKSMMVMWLANLRAVLVGLLDLGAITTSSGCSGTDIWLHVLDLATRFWTKDWPSKLSSSRKYSKKKP